MTTPDPMDQPESDAYDLAVPFIVCQSQGGPYDDDSFVAGFQAGQVDRALERLAAMGATELQVTVLSTLVRQLELIAMYRGFPVMRTEVSEEVPEWTLVTFRTKAE